MSTYWERRVQMADASLEKSEQAIAKRTHKYYEDELAELSREIASYYKKYGESNVLSYRSMLETMDASDRNLLMHDCEQFAIEHPELADMVEIRKSIYKLDRLEGLQANAKLRLVKATAKASAGLDEHFAKTAANAANVVKQTMGDITGFHTFDSEAIRRFVGTHWADGESFSQTIWRNTQKLADYVQQDLAKALARGVGYEQLVDELRSRFVGVSESSLMRLVQTEGTYVARTAQAAELQKEGFESYFVTPIGDERTCKICKQISDSTHSESYKFEDAVVGVNFPPLHPRCRCQIEPAVEDWGEWIKSQLDQHRAQKAKHDILHEDEPLVKAKNGIKNHYSVNYKKVNSKEYHDKFSNLPYKKTVREQLYQCAGEILKDMDGTSGERMFAIDVRTAKVVANTMDYVPESLQVSFNASDKKKIIDNKHQVVFLHNHPGGSYPSAADVMSAVTNDKVIGSVVSGHDGSLYLINPHKCGNIIKRWDELYSISTTVVSDRKLAEQIAFSWLEEENELEKWYTITSL